MFSLPPLRSERFILPQLPYSYDALSPAIHPDSVKRHYLDNHAGYVNNLNKLLKSEQQNKSLLQLALETPTGTPINNNAAQAWAHWFWWNSMCPVGTSRPPSYLDMNTFKQTWVEKGKSLFGSGWLWAVSSGQDVEIIALPNAVLPQRYGVTPLLVMDLWEHAYYCQYGTKRADYLTNTFALLNWQAFDERFAAQHR